MNLTCLLPNTNENEPKAQYSRCLFRLPNSNLVVIWYFLINFSITVFTTLHCRSSRKRYKSMGWYHLKHAFRFLYDVYSNCISNSFQFNTRTVISIRKRWKSSSFIFFYFIPSEMSMRKKRADQTADTGIRVTTCTIRDQGPDSYGFFPQSMDNIVFSPSFLQNCLSEK